MNDDPTAPQPRLGLARLIAYAAPAAPAAAVETPVAVYLPAFYAAAGLGLAQVGGLFLLARVVEAAAAVGLGAAADRFGQGPARRLWMLAAAPLALAGLAALFLPPPHPSAAWLLAGLLAALIGAAGLQVSHAAWGAEAAAGYDERTRAQAARQVAAVAGLILVLAAPSLVQGETTRLRAIALAFAVLLPLTVAAALLFGPKPAPRPPHAGGWTWGAAREALARDPALRRLLLVDLLDSAAFGVVTSLFVLLARDVWGLGRLAGPMILAYLAAGVVVLPGLLAAVRGRHKARAAALLALSLACAVPALLLVSPAAAVPAFAAVVVLGAPSAANSALFDSLMADIAAADARARGGVRTGLFFALHMLAGRLGRAVALAAAFWLLDRIGFRPQAANAPAAVEGFKALYVGAPLVLQLLIAALMWRFPEPGQTPQELCDTSSFQPEREGSLTGN